MAPPQPSPDTTLDSLDRTPSLTNSDASMASDPDTIGDSEFFPGPHDDHHRQSLEDYRPTSPSFLEHEPDTKPHRYSSLRTVKPFGPRALSSKQMMKQPQARSITTAFVHAISTPRCLACLLSFVQCDSFLSLSQTSRDVRTRLWARNTREIVLSRFVPGYHAARRMRDPMWDDRFQLGLRDLELLVRSLSLPLHLYPTFSLSILSSPALDWRQHEKVMQYEALAAAHSRMILVLQSMIHSSPLPIPSELDDARWRTSINLYAGLRELTFPAPLSYFSPQSSEKQLPPMPYRKDSKHARRSSMPPERARLKSRQYQHQLSLSNTTEDSAATLTSMRHHRSQSQLPTVWADPNLFKSRTKVPPPPPLEEPESLRLYSSRRRRQYARSHTLVESEDENLFKPPSRRFISTNLSSDSSIASAPTRLSSHTTTSFAPQSSYTSSSSTSSTTASSSPHDLHVATSRTRAPILRVFVPCTDLAEESIALCEQQLVRHGLWEHLSVGDIVCNLGYIPSTDEEDGTESQKPGGQNATTQRQHWLIFTTEGLQPYSPTDAPPISNALSLPSPLYYYHILPPTINPRFVLAIPQRNAGTLPSTSLSPYSSTRSQHIRNNSIASNISTSVSVGGHTVHFNLTLLTTTVSSTASPSGIAKVKKYAWLATFDMRGAGDGANLNAYLESAYGRFDGALESGPGVGIGSTEIGEGWRAEWVLQSEGTNEGRSALFDALQGGPGSEREWEIVKERCGYGKLWLRLVSGVPTSIHNDAGPGVQTAATAWGIGQAA